MKTSRALLIGCGAFPLAVVMLFFVGFCSTSGIMSAGGNPPRNAWLVLNPTGVVADYNEYRGSILFGSPQPSVEEICRKVRYAANDKRIIGLLIKPGMFEANYAGLAEISAAITAFRESGKSVIAYGNMLSQKSYLLCAMADTVYMEPSASAGILLEGMAANVLFYRDALSKLGIKMHVMQSGEFKGAGEPYSRMDLSEGTRDNLSKALRGRYDALLSQITKLRQTDSTFVRPAFESRPGLIINGEEAVRYKLVDALVTYESFKARHDIDPKHVVPVSAYESPMPAATGNRVAVMNLNGAISPEVGLSMESTISAAKVQRMIDDIEKDKTIKAVVLRINSPGGSALESELIYQKLKQLGQRLPLVVSMGSVAASGGYYISCAGSHIFADPYTITGSIGVIMAIPEITGLGDKLGIASDTVSHGKFAGELGLFRQYSPEMLESLKQNSTSVYDEFRARVAEARGIAAENMDAVSGGRVFNALDAKELRLIDEIGGLRVAVKEAAALAGTAEYTVRMLPGKIGIFQALTDSGGFNLIAKYVLHRGIDPAEHLEKYLRQVVTPNEWLYFCPYRLD
jgi:protease-4